VARLADRHVERLEVKTETHGSVPSVKERKSWENHLTLGCSICGNTMESISWEKSCLFCPFFWLCVKMPDLHSKHKFFWGGRGKHDDKP